MTTKRNLPPRTGQQYTIVHGDYRATVAQLGAILRELTYKGEPILASFGADELVNCCAGQPLIPFPNRIEGGTYTFDGVDYELPIDEHERNNAIHGYGYRSYWNLDSLSGDEVTLWWRVPDLAGYPFDVVVTLTYRLDDDGLHIHFDAYNNDDKPAPWALAMHPWLANGGWKHGDDIDADNARCRLQIPAKTHVVVNGNLIPTGLEPVDGTKFDFRADGGRLLDDQPYDDALTDVEHEADGTVTALFTRPDGLKIRIVGDETITSFQVCDGTGFPPDSHPAGVAVEPQTAYANAFKTGDDLIVIEPGTSSETDLLIGVVAD
ncbi:aldose 1-epimerase family protein [Bifidobacterium choloepi]|uniref:Aldose 1-epimerase family protein n=1 Tax=Bifidobacterium choloepi TaxID=2614131 RepID=A0A6I5NMY0_9BIFI|nr:aldose 1-epimerase family protein [Bifidobacterium choloepi]NEG70082.1 aldose 1-epimerase family protein [Bifidobacterium choloepi]